MDSAPGRRDDSTPRRRRAIAAALALVGLIALVYANSVRAPFVFDDEGAVVNNPTIRHLDSWAVLSPPADGSTTTGRPFVNFSYALNYRISGGRPWSYHVANIGVHALCALLLFGIVRRVGATRPKPMFADERRRGMGVDATAWFIALVWALHPLQTETVVGTAQRTESLCGFFYLLTAYAFVRAVALDAEHKPSLGWYLVSSSACLFGMATKEVMVTAPVAVLLLDRTFFAGSFQEAWQRHRRYYAALAATWLLLLALVVQSGGARGVAAGFGRGISSWQYLLQQTDAIVLYLKLAIWPHPLVVDYGTRVPDSLVDVWWQVLLVLALLGAVGWALVRRPVVGFFGATFFLILAPSSSVVPLVTQTMAEHRMYLPLALVLAGGVGVVNAILCHARRFCALVALALALLTHARNADYRDAVTLWASNVARYPSAARGHNNLALALVRAGKVAVANDEFARAVALDPRYVSAHYNWGVSLLDQQQLDAAMRELRTAVTLAPGHVDARVDLGNALVRAGRPADAATEYEAALAVKPAADIHYDLGVALVAMHRDDDAATHFRAATRMDPSLTRAWRRLGEAEERAGKLGDAKVAYAAAIHAAPDDATMHARLGALLARSGELPSAIEHLEAAIRLNPDDTDARANLGNALLLSGRTNEAIACYEEVLRRRPNDERTQENLALARASGR